MILSVNRSVTCVALTEIVFQNSEYFRPEHVGKYTKISAAKRISAADGSVGIDSQRDT